MLAYCDYIGYRVHRFLDEVTRGVDTYLAKVDKVEWDLDADGAFASTTKTMVITDRAGKKYRLTIEEI